MKHLLKLLSVVLLFTAGAWCQRSSTGNITAQGATCATTGACVSLNIDNATGGATFTLSGTFSGTVQFEASGDNGTTWNALNVYPLNSTTATTSTGTAGTYQANVSGLTGIRIRCSSFTSGPIVSTIQSATSSARAGGGGGGGGGGGTGTVTNTVGPLVAQECVIGNDGNDIQVDPLCSTDGAGDMTVQTLKTPTDPSSNGIVEFAGNTALHALDSNSFAIGGPSSATFTSWGLYPSVTAPTAGQCLAVTQVNGAWIQFGGATCGTGGGGGITSINGMTNAAQTIAQGTGITVTSSGGTTTIASTAVSTARDLPIAVAQGAGGCSLGGSFPLANAPGCLVNAGTSSTIQNAVAQFGSSTPYIEYQFTLRTTNVTLKLSFYSETTSTGNAVWSLKYACATNGTPRNPALSAAQTLSVTLDGTAGHNLNGTLALSITGCSIGDLFQIRLGLDPTTTATGNIDLEAAQVLFQ